MDDLLDLIDRGYAEDDSLIASVSANGAAGYLCLNGDIVTYVDAAHNKVFSDSVDRITDIKISGLFSKKLSFACAGKDYVFAVKGGKNVLDYFRLLIG